MAGRIKSEQLKTWCGMVLLVCMLNVHISKSQSNSDSDNFEDQLKSTIEQLPKLIIQQQKTENDVPLPGQQTILTKGTYGGVYKINLAGKETESIKRRSIGVEDRNAFDAEWISLILLEAYKYGGAPAPSDNQLILSIDYCAACEDTRLPYNNSIIGFWPYAYNSATQKYDMQATFFLQLLNTVRTLPFNALTDAELPAETAFAVTLGTVDGFLTAIGLDKYFDGFLQMLSTVPGDSSAYPDFDCTFVWIGLGSILETIAGDFPDPRNRWVDANQNITSVFNAMKKYAYRPFSDDIVANTIDTRTYYVLRGFLDEAVQTGRDVALIPSWVTAIDEQENLFVNDVGGVVCSNFVFGFTSSLLSGLVDPEILQDPDVAQIYHNTTAVLAYMISTSFNGRQDLALPYYQHRFMVYVSLARSVSLMYAHVRHQPLPDDLMDELFSILTAVAEAEMTQDILYDAQTDERGDIYFDDFLGDGDLTEDNQPLIRAEDRIYSTAMATNALMFTWLSYDSSTGKSQWKDHTPTEVKETVTGSVRWLARNTLSGKFKPWNSFDTVRDKSEKVLPRYYPSNYFSFYDGSPIENVAAVSPELVATAVRGYIPPEEYECMLNKTHFGQPTPTTFVSFNDPGWTGNIFESCESFTYAVTLLALSRFTQIEE